MMSAQESIKTVPFRVSPSVHQTVEDVGAKEPISAAAFAMSLFKLHNEYAGGSAASLQLEETAARRMPQEWLSDIETLFDPKRIQSASASSSVKFESVDQGLDYPTLHGRLVIIGLCLLDAPLREQLNRAGRFAPLEKELREPLPAILTARGRELYESTLGMDGYSDSVPNWSDDPLLHPDQDLLGRAAFARFLAKRIAGVALESGAYSMHVYGPWGAGKSSLLNFLRQELEQPTAAGRRWLVVEFNAWRHQHIQPPWWSLMDRIFRETKSSLSRWGRFHEYWWRFSTGRLQYILAAIVLAWLLAVGLSFVPGTSAPRLKPFAETAESFSKIFAVVATIWGGILAVNRSLLFGAAHAAQSYAELTNDPTSEIRRRFAGLVENLRPARVAVLIDDLDRCQSRYVVDLLEGVQTLFREAPVVFVVAADRHWLNACYEEVYEKLRPRIYEPGKPLGMLFLEKAFRFSTPMPGLPDDLRKEYWEYLLQLAPREHGAEAAAARDKARNEVANTGSEGAVLDLVDNSRQRPFLEQRALREEAAIRLAAPEILRRLEHTLKSYGQLLEPNPRAMKLLVNSYSANRALAILSELDIDGRAGLPQTRTATRALKMHVGPAAF
jgi:hypothetical protein